MPSFKGSNGNVIVGRRGWLGDVKITIKGGNERETGLEWREARKLAYAILDAVDEHVDKLVGEDNK